jgi:hypothetical protein
MLNIQSYYAKLANKETITEDEIVSLLKELAHFQGSLAYLASCQAATLEGLPKSTSKSSRGRHVGLCTTAAAMLIGDSSSVRYPAGVDAARERCLKAAKECAEDPGRMASQ